MAKLFDKFLGYIGIEEDPEFEGEGYQEDYFDDGADAAAEPQDNILPLGGRSKKRSANVVRDVYKRQTERILAGAKTGKNKGCLCVGSEHKAIPALIRMGVLRGMLPAAYCQRIAHGWYTDGKLARYLGKKSKNGMFFLPVYGIIN